MIFPSSKSTPLHKSTNEETRVEVTRLKLESLWHYYDEHAIQARQHETQRANITNIFFIVSAGLISFIATLKFTLIALPVAIAMPLIANFAAKLNMKHYERNHFHRKIMEQISNQIDEIQCESLGTAEDGTLNYLRKKGRDKHSSIFIEKDVLKTPLYEYWNNIPKITGILGLIFIAIIFAKLALSFVPCDKESASSPICHIIEESQTEENTSLN